MVRKSQGSDILNKALSIAEDREIHAHNAIQQASVDLRATDDDRQLIQDIYSRAILSMKIGFGVDYDKELLRECLRLLDPNAGPSRGRINKRPKKQKEKEQKMTENTNIENQETNVTTEAPAPKRLGRARKYKLGDVYNTVKNFGLVPIGQREGLNPTVGFQLSYKENKSKTRGFRILPEGSAITYIGVRYVHERDGGGVGGRKMIFKLLAGTTFIDGTSLESDLEIAGVVSHFTAPVQATETTAAEEQNQAVA